MKEESLLDDLKSLECILNAHSLCIQSSSLLKILKSSFRVFCSGTLALFDNNCIAQTDDSRPIFVIISCAWWWCSWSWIWFLSFCWSCCYSWCGWRCAKDMVSRVSMAAASYHAIAWEQYLWRQSTMGGMRGSLNRYTIFEDRYTIFEVSTVGGKGLGVENCLPTSFKYDPLRCSRWCTDPGWLIRHTCADII